LLAQPVQQLPAARIGESFEHFAFISNHALIMQPFGCMSRAILQN
jgi:hypothetical protein